MSAKMVKSFSDSADFLYLHGVLFEIQGYGSKSTEAYEAAMAKEPGHPGATFRMASFLDRTGEDAEAMALYEQLRKLRPTHINTALNLGTLYEDKGDYEKALECYQAILDFFPTHPRARLYFKDARASVSMFYDEDAARRTFGQPGERILRQPEGGLDTDVEHAVEHIVGHVGEARWHEIGGIVQNDVDPAEAIPGAHHHRPHRLAIAHVERVKDGGAAGFGNSVTTE